ncbi:hypothetical protein HYX14_04175 [Candidatus Woesearchaeota archaeon]|nr:hypothetical protein [Candidatus Woesearchaeota archaeon]
MTPGLSLGLSLGLRQELRLEQRLELSNYIAHDFHEYINIEDDEDQPLLRESLPFLVLHELSHPLEDKGRIYIPQLQLSDRLSEKITPSGYQNGFETSIDKAGMLLGPLACDFWKAKPEHC